MLLRSNGRFEGRRAVVAGDARWRVYGFRGRQPATDLHDNPYAIFLSA